MPAADVSFAYDPNGYATQQTVTQNADGSTSIDIKAFNPDGSLANETLSTTSADGLSRTIRFDHNGNGIFDQTQTIVNAVNGDGSRSNTVANFDVSGALANRTVTTTSLDGKTVTIARDLDGNGIVDQSEAARHRMPTAARPSPFPISMPTASLRATAPSPPPAPRRA